MLFSVLVLALVQGICEFLPVSSSGHLVFINKFFNVGGDFILLSIVLHVATLVAVVIVLWKDVYRLIKRPLSPLGRKLVVATIPTVILVLIFKKIYAKAFSGAYLPFCFMLTGVVIMLSEFLNHKDLQTDKKCFKCLNGSYSNINDNNKFRYNLDTSISYFSAIVMGLMQGIAVLPGISRSGFTICGGILTKNERNEVIRFSFLMSIPIILASLLFEILDFVHGGQTLAINPIYLLLGFVVALVVGLLSVKFMLKFVSNHSIIPFAIYLAIISVLSFFLR